MLGVALLHFRPIAALVLAACAGLLASCRDPAGVAAGAPVRADGRSRSAPAPAPVVALDRSRALRRIAFGSCLDQNKPQPIWDAIEAYDPQLMLMLGDNVYADAETVPMIADAYAALAASPGFGRLRADTPVFAVWDDHDYGRNDAGAEYPLKRESQAAFLDFFGVASDSPRRERPGTYHAEIVGPPGQRTQIIGLDTRYFRSELSPIAPSRYRNDDSDEVTMLGAAQWAWLAEQLRQPAELRLLISSVQVVADEHDRERWGVFPKQRERLLALIGETNAKGVIVLSGDRHRGELSQLTGSSAGYPLYDVTSSSFNRPVVAVEGNSTRIGELVTIENFGTIDIVWEGQAHVVLTLRDQAGTAAVQHTVALDSLAR